jgi:PAS domain S-box-containing protein
MFVARRHPGFRPKGDPVPADARLGAILDRLVAFVGTLTPEGVLTSVNAPALAIAGLTRDDVIGKPLWDSHWWNYDPAIMGFFRCAIARAAAGEPQRFDIEARTSGAERMMIEVLLSPSIDETGSVTEIVASGLDVTTRYNVGRRLAEANAVLDAIFEGAPLGIGLWDRDLRFVRVNRRLAEINGLSPQAHLGRMPHEILPDIEGIEEVYSVFQKVFDTGAPTQMEIVGATPAEPDKVRTWSEHFFPVRNDGQVQMLAAIVEETTERRAEEQRIRESEQRLRTLFDSIDEGYCLCEIILDAAGAPIDYRFLEINAHFETMTGLKNALGRTAQELAPDLEKRWFALYGDVALNGRTMRFENRSDALDRTFEVFATPVPPRGRFALVFSDISERKQAEAYRELLIDELNHRVKNVLATIQAMASHTMRDAPSLDAFRSAFSGRLAAIAAAHDTIFNSGQGAADLESLVTKQVGPYAGSDPARLQFSGPPVRLPAAHAHALALVLHELATNAAKHGALSLDTGRIVLDWTVSDDSSGARLDMTWRESGGPTAAAPTRRGFGSRLIESALSHSLGGSVEMAYECSGLSVRLELPIGRRHAKP